MDAFAHAAWRRGYDVRFPGFARTLATPYRSLASTDFDAALRGLLPEGTIRSGTRALVLDDTEIDPRRRRADRRARGDRLPRARPSPHLTGGLAGVLGRHVRTKPPHELERPVIMDATVEQYQRLPLRLCACRSAANELFVEDTYYARRARCSTATLLAERLDAYCTQARAGRAKCCGEETGVLPVVTGGDFDGVAGEHGAPGVAPRRGARRLLASADHLLAAPGGRRRPGDRGIQPTHWPGAHAPLLEDRARRALARDAVLPAARQDAVRRRGARPALAHLRALLRPATSG